MKFSDAESFISARLIITALLEDLNPDRLLYPPLRKVVPPEGDRTSQAIIPRDNRGAAVFVARSNGILAGLPAVQLVLEKVDEYLPSDRPEAQEGKTAAFAGETPSIHSLLEDGGALRKGDRIARIEGSMRSILAAERIALNFLQHLSGVATLTGRFVEAVKGLPCRIFDTRKTLPGWRLLEKYAVRCGGGFNHRMGLYDGVLIKDNHLAALGGGPDAIRQSIQLVREKNGPDVPVEIEVENLNLLEVALACHTDIVLLDNMSLDQLRQAVRRRNELAPGIQLEASGGITLDNVLAVAETGVDRISVGALTHSAPALDIALDYAG